MAFVQVETWSPDPFQRIGAPARLHTTGPLSKLLANGREANARRTMALALSLALHLGLMWVVLNKLTTGIGKTEGQGHGEGITMVNLSGLKSADSLPSAAGVAAPQPMPTPVSSPIEVSAPSETFMPEWTVSKLRVAEAHPIIATATAPAVAGSVNGQTGSVGTGAGGGGLGYDPYAGASPQRRDPNSAVASGDARQASGLGERVMGWLGFGSGSVAPVLNQESFEKAAQAVRQATPRVRGRLEVEARISNEGVVLEVHVRNFALDIRDLEHAQSALIGRKLFNSRPEANDAQWVILPVIILT